MPEHKLAYFGLALLLTTGCTDDAGIDDAASDTTGDGDGDPGDGDGDPGDGDGDGDTGDGDGDGDPGDGDGDTSVCAEVLGLFANADCETLAEGIVSFTPHYKLWSDGLVKTRYIYLPPGETVDTSDPDSWSFPVGTRMWKHFATSEGMKLETRIIEKVVDEKGPDAWEFTTYQWNDAQDDVIEITDGAQNVLGSDHDIPAVEDCTECHSGGDNNQMGMGALGQDEINDAPLGFSAIQLNHDESDTTVTTLWADGWISDEVSTTDALIPGDATAQAALGYLHANCGHCHGGARPHGGMVMWIDVGTPSVETTTTYLETVNVATGMSMGMGLQDMPDTRILPGDPDNSAIPWRMGKRTNDDAPMPPLATEVIDDDGLAAVTAWIIALGD